MKRYIFLIAIIAVALTSCQKEDDVRKVTYLVTGLSSPFKVVYISEDDSTMVDTISPTSISQKWTVSHYQKPGKPAYIYIEGTDVVGLQSSVTQMKFNMSILVDNKIVQKALNYDILKYTTADTLFVVKRSCTIPF